MADYGKLKQAEAGSGRHSSVDCFFHFDVHKNIYFEFFGGENISKRNTFKTKF